MEFRREKGLNQIKKLWRLRYRMYAVLVLLMSVFIFNSDTATAVKVVVPEDSLNYRVVEQNLLTSKVEFRAIQDTLTQVETIIHRGEERLVVKENQYLLSKDQDLKRIDRLGYVYNRPRVVFSPNSFTPEPEQKITLNDLIPAPDNAQRRNFLEYPRFNIKSPIITTTAADLYTTAADGTVDFTKPIIEDPAAYAGGNYESTPVLRKLLDGVVLLNGVPFLPEPGELGNSYIVGHGRNYANAGSPYSQIFEPLVDRSQTGDEVFIWDGEGRKLTFRVFQNDLIDFQDVDTAYGWKSGVWNNRRIVTLQTCKLEWIPGTGWYPSKRWLVRAELVVNQ